MSSSDDDDRNIENVFDIAQDLVRSGNESESSLDNLNSDSDSGSDSEIEIQDEILSSSDEESSNNRKKSEKKTLGLKEMPKINLSDDEDDDSGDEKITNLTADSSSSVKKPKNGSFASFGLSKNIVINISKKGYKQPTPIQRKTIPLIIQGRDVVAMARTGSGKTAAFILPLVERLKVHSAKIGSRAIILSPTRELALQTFKVVKEFSKNTDLRSVLLVGGDSLGDQFSSILSNPDIIVATPGRFLHLKVEMSLDLKTVEYIVFDEADRLFEMGFSEQLNELLVALPSNRQSLLFSATLPGSLVEFAKAGLSNPVLVRLDSETKISDDLQMAFLSAKKSEKESILLYLLQRVIKVPFPNEEDIKRIKEFDNSAYENDESESDFESEEKDKKKNRKFNNKSNKKNNNNKRKYRKPVVNQVISKHSTIIFVPTRHHVEYVSNLLIKFGYSIISGIYGSLNQVARNKEIKKFSYGLSYIMVVTDVAARGIDIPMLSNVVNFSLPSSSKIFIHRIGRTARAGNKGWAYSILEKQELPYLLDLEIFLGKKVLLTTMHEKKCEILKDRIEEAEGKGKEDENVGEFVEPIVSYNDRLVLGSVPRMELEDYIESFNGIIKSNYELQTLQDVSKKGEKLYLRTRVAASNESIKRSKELVNNGWDEQNLLFGKNLEKEKDIFLQKLQNRKNKITVFEFNKNNEEMIEFMNKRRRQIAPIRRKAEEKKKLLEKERIAGLTHNIEDEILQGKNVGGDEVGYSVLRNAKGDEEDGESMLNGFETAEDVKHQNRQKQKRKTFKDANYLSHYPSTASIQDRQLAVNDNTSGGFLNGMLDARFDLDNDDKVQVNKQTMRWDKKKGKYINSKSTDKRYITGESGQRIPASYKAGKFNEWRQKQHISRASLRAGARENTDAASSGAFAAGAEDNHGRRFKHRKVTAPRQPDKFRDNYQAQRKKVESAVDRGVAVKGFVKAGTGRRELRSAEEIRKQRELKERRRAKNARPSRKKR
ncbi:ATP-dependent RNA helicase DBP10 [Ascoidea rubescens DSM 1968]|uniref:ATP-dependent RNA helicase DBP10 n=1 Tax=Ascoidea rubescens DSM 1968 TaxID=1344418 RepID=A0A1D2VGM8_9ASCO|nr:DEAD-domain-containing protein [Ascoidea rubescens DSM 1968]ODV60814.1 DEAD-domain-containing protein [Ascoidea rubescens DSM 1968]